MRSQSERRRQWRPTTVLMLLIILLIAASEAQRIMAQWAGHRERQEQLYVARANAMKLDALVARVEQLKQAGTPQCTASTKRQSKEPQS